MYNFQLELWHARLTMFKCCLEESDGDGMKPYMLSFLIAYSRISRELR